MLRVIAILTLLMGSQAAAGELETVRIPGSDFYLVPHETETIQLSSWRYIKKLYVYTSGACTSCASFDVIVNGDIKRTVRTSAAAARHEVKVGESARTIQIRHRGGSGVNVSQIYAVQSDCTVDPDRFERDLDSVWNDATYWELYNSGSIGHQFPEVSPLPVSNRASAIAKRAIILSERLERHANYKEYGQFILPIKKVAARTYSIASARGELSRATRQYLIMLKRQIEAAYDYLDGTFERDAAFNDAVELMSLGRRLEILLQ